MVRKLLHSFIMTRMQITRFVYFVEKLWWKCEKLIPIEFKWMMPFLSNMRMHFFQPLSFWKEVNAAKTNSISMYENCNIPIHLSNWYFSVYIKTNNSKSFFAVQISKIFVREFGERVATATAAEKKLHLNRLCRHTFRFDVCVCVYLRLEEERLHYILT